MAEQGMFSARSGSIAEPERMEKNNLIGHIGRSDSAKRGATSGYSQ